MRLRHGRLTDRQCPTDKRQHNHIVNAVAKLFNIKGLMAHYPSKKTWKLGQKPTMSRLFHVLLYVYMTAIRPLRKPSTTGGTAAALQTWDVLVAILEPAAEEHKDLFKTHDSAASAEAKRKYNRATASDATVAQGGSALAKGLVSSTTWGEKQHESLPVYDTLADDLSDLDDGHVSKRPPTDSLSPSDSTRVTSAISAGR